MGNKGTRDQGNDAWGLEQELAGFAGRVACAHEDERSLRKR